ncbi:MAG: peptidylprolyl isomerase [Holosporaceae bacterium]|nr:peptidylprolyl isomerase [Holosporaceae bacterium]
MKSFFCMNLAAILSLSCVSGVATDSERSLKKYEGIVAIVNDDIITLQDLEERVRLVLFSDDSSVSPELRAQITREVLKEMIQEKLKLQCTKKYSPKEGWVSPEMERSAFSSIAKRNNMDDESFCKLLKSKNINKEVLLQQIRGNLSWIAYINARFGRFINISESEINRAVAEFKEKRNKASYYVCRMFFPVSDSRNESVVSSRANNIMQMLSNGANFNNLARQFSQSADANKGGEIGWIFHGQLSPEENAALQKMPVGGRAVIRNSRGYVILFLRDKKEAGSSSFTTLRFVQVVVPFRESKLTKEELGHIENFLIDMRRNSSGCQDFIKRARESEICAITDPVEIVLEEAQPQFRPMLAALPARSVGNPMAMPNGVVAICMLDRKTQKIPEPTREEIRAEKVNERLSVFADREVQDLRKKADIKMSAGAMFAAAK